MARMIFHCKDTEGNLVDFETSEHEGKELIETYNQHKAWLLKNGLTLIKAKTFKAREKVQIDGKTCPACKSPIFDNRAKKASGEYKATAPDFACSNKACTGGHNQTKWACWPDQYELVQAN